MLFLLKCSVDFIAEEFRALALLVLNENTKLRVSNILGRVFLLAGPTKTMALKGYLFWTTPKPLQHTGKQQHHKSG